MSISANLHKVQKMEAYDASGTHWLRVEDAYGNSFTIFMPHATAQAIVAAWEAAQVPE